MALRGDPIQGPKLSFHAPLPASKDQRLTGQGLDRTFARVLCKDGIGAFLGLPRAAPRISNFTEGNPNLPNLNEGARFAVNEKVGEKPYTITLAPGTAVKMGRYDWSTEDAPTVRDVFMKTLQIFVPGHIQVWSMLRWLSEVAPTAIVGNTESQPLPGFPASNSAGYGNIADNYKKIISLTTPNGRKYNVRSILYPDPVRLVVPPFGDGPVEP